MEAKKTKMVLLLPIAILILAVMASTFLQNWRYAGLDDTYWIRVNAGEDAPETIDTSRFSIRKIEIKDFSLISTVASVSERARENGFKKGDLDFYGNFVGEKIVGMTHYRTSSCGLDVYSPLELSLSEDRKAMYGTELVPVFDPHACGVWPQEDWTPVNFTLHRVPFKG